MTELGDHLPKPTLFCLCYTLQAMFQSPSMQRSCIPFRVPPTTRRIPNLQTRTDLRRLPMSRVFPIYQYWYQRILSPAFSPRVPMQGFGLFSYAPSGLS